MSAAMQPTPAPNVELELAKLANDAMASGADPHEVTQKLHQTISYLRQFPKMAEHATNALADGVASPADISRTLWPHVSAMQHATGSNAPTEEEAANLPADKPGFAGGLAAHLTNVASGFPGAKMAAVGFRGLLRGQPYDEAYRDIDSATGRIGAIPSAVEKIAGSIPAFGKIPGSNMAKGAIVGALHGATDADPEADRAQETVIGGLAGGALGLGSDLVGAGVSKLGNLARSQGAKEIAVAKAIAERARNAVGRFRGTPINRPPVRMGTSSTLRPGTVPGLVGNTPPEVTPGTSPTSIEDLLQSMVGKMRNAQPGEVGNQIGDAELAMRPHATDDLEDLLRRSLSAKGVKPLSLASP